MKSSTVTLLAALLLVPLAAPGLVEDAAA